MPNLDWPGQRADSTLIGRATQRRHLERLLLEARTGQSRVLVLRGRSGIGKTALVEHLLHTTSGCRRVGIRASESEADARYSGLRLVCSALEDGLGALAAHQRQALTAAFSAGSQTEPDRFLVGIATLNLLTGIAETLPLLCVIDDAQWLDSWSARVLGFVARRLRAMRAVLLFAERVPAPADELRGLPELVLGGLGRDDARLLFDSVALRRVDDDVAERIITETRGNPRAILAAAREHSAAELAGGFAVPLPRDDRDDEVRGLLALLAPEPRTMLLAAAAEPTGDLALLWRAAAHLGMSPDALRPLTADGLLSLGTVLTFRDPALRSRLYALAASEELRTVHRALAAATNPTTNADRRCWHRAHALDGYDDEVADELIRHAARARERAGIAAQAAFLRMAATLTSDPGRRVRRMIAAAAAEHEAGMSESALGLLEIAEAGPIGATQRAELAGLRASVVSVFTADPGAAGMLSAAAHQLAALAPARARIVGLEALSAAMLSGPPGGRGAVGIAPDSLWQLSGRESASALDLLLEGLLARRLDGHVAAVDSLTAALHGLSPVLYEHGAVRLPWLVSLVAADLWDDQTWDAVTADALRRARSDGALTALPYALTERALLLAAAGDLPTATALTDQAATASALLGHPSLPSAALVVAAWRGHEHPALELIDKANRAARDRGDGRTSTTASVAAAVLYNGLGRYDQALEAARHAGAHDEPGLFGWSLVELVEAATRAGDQTTAARALDLLTERTTASGTDWALGAEARSHALLLAGPAAEDLYVEAIELLGRTRISTQLARARLVYGEWLRHRGKRVAAREPLRAAHDAFAAMGAHAFAARAQRELLATGDQARNRSETIRSPLTEREMTIAALARDGLTNAEIGTRLTITARTVEYHLRKVFTKLGIATRTELHLVLPDRPE